MPIYDMTCIVRIARDRRNNDMTKNNDIVLNGVVIGKVFERLEGGYELWIPHNLVMVALEQDTGTVEFTH